MTAVMEKTNLVVPMGFVEIDSEEMTYVEGGSSRPVAVAAKLGFNLDLVQSSGVWNHFFMSTITVNTIRNHMHMVAGGAALAGQFLKKTIIGLKPGFLGTVIAAILGIAAAGLAQVNIHNRGIIMSVGLGNFRFMSQ